ncbi:histidine kinase [Campylobacter jejuni]|nr:histidine kinase [Campylobacter jejuni]
MQEYTFALKIGEDYLISPIKINPNKTLFSYCDIESAQELYKTALQIKVI